MYSAGFKKQINKIFKYISVHFILKHISKSDFKYLTFSMEIYTLIKKFRIV